MKNLASYFVQKTRSNGETFYTLTDDAPEELLAAVREAHNDALPNDWVYSILADFAHDVGKCAAADEPSDYVYEWADGCVDIYTKPLMQWAADMSYTNFVDVSAPCERTIEESIRLMQFEAIVSIASTLLEYFQSAE